MMIKILITGGTIDKVYNPLTGAMAFNKTQLVEMLNQGRSMVETTSEVLFLKDSLDLSESDRALILDKCTACKERHILISHGTDTMVKTAQLLSQQIKDKTIVIFGAMVPYSVNHSDALFNLGIALQAVQLQKSGVYIAMNGQLFAADSVEKNTELGIFQLPS